MSQSQYAPEYPESADKWSALSQNPLHVDPDILGDVVEFLRAGISDVLTPALASHLHKAEPVAKGLTYDSNGLIYLTFGYTIDSDEPVVKRVHTIISGKRNGLEGEAILTPRNTPLLSSLGYLEERIGHFTRIADIELGGADNAALWAAIPGAVETLFAACMTKVETCNQRKQEGVQSFVEYFTFERYGMETGAEARHADITLKGFYEGLVQQIGEGDIGAKCYHPNLKEHNLPIMLNLAFDLARIADGLFVPNAKVTGPYWQDQEFGRKAREKCMAYQESHPELADEIEAFTGAASNLVVGFCAKRKAEYRANLFDS